MRNIVLLVIGAASLSGAMVAGCRQDTAVAARGNGVARVAPQFQRTPTSHNDDSSLSPDALVAQAELPGIFDPFGELSGRGSVVVRQHAVQTEDGHAERELARALASELEREENTEFLPTRPVPAVLSSLPAVALPISLEDFIRTPKTPAGVYAMAPAAALPTRAPAPAPADERGVDARPLGDNNVPAPVVVVTPRDNNPPQPPRISMNDFLAPGQTAPTAPVSAPRPALVTAAPVTAAPMMAPAMTAPAAPVISAPAAPLPVSTSPVRVAVRNVPAPTASAPVANPPLDSFLAGPALSALDLDVVVAPDSAWKTAPDPTLDPLVAGASPAALELDLALGAGEAPMTANRETTAWPAAPADASAASRARAGAVAERPAMPVPPADAAPVAPALAWKGTASAARPVAAPSTDALIRNADEDARPARSAVVPPLSADAWAQNSALPALPPMPAATAAATVAPVPMPAPVSAPALAAVEEPIARDRLASIERRGPSSDKSANVEADALQADILTALLGDGDVEVPVAPAAVSASASGDGKVEPLRSERAAAIAAPALPAPSPELAPAPTAPIVPVAPVAAPLVASSAPATPIGAPVSVVSAPEVEPVAEPRVAGALTPAPAEVVLIAGGAKDNDAGNEAVPAPVEPAEGEAGENKPAATANNDGKSGDEAQPAADDPAARLLEAEKRKLLHARQQRQAEAEYELARGKDNFAAGNYDEAILRFNRALKANPELGEATDLLRRAENLRHNFAGDPGERLIGEQATLDNAMAMARETVQRVRELLAAGHPSEDAPEQALTRRQGELNRARDNLAATVEMLRTPMPTPDMQQLRAEAAAVQDELRVAVREIEGRQRLLQYAAAEDRAAASAREASDLQQRQLRERINACKRLVESGQYWDAHTAYKRLYDQNPTMKELEDAVKETFLLYRSAETNRLLKASQDTIGDHSLDTLDKNRLILDPIHYPENWNPDARFLTVGDDADNDAEAAIRRKLELTLVTDQYLGVEVQDVAERLMDQTGVNIVVDQSIHDAMRVVNFTVTQRPARDVLDYLRDLADVRWEIDNEAVFISTAERSQRIVRFYPAADYFWQPRHYRAKRRTWGMGDLIEDDDDDDDDDDDEDDRLTPTDLIDSLKASVGWDEENGEDAMERWGRNNLVVNAPLEVHLRIQEFFRQNRAMSKQQVLVEARFLQITDNALQELGMKLGMFNFTRGLDGANGNVGSSFSPSVGVDDRFGGIVGTTGAYTAGTSFDFNYLKSWGSGSSMRTVSMQVLINAMRETNSGQVLHSPRLMTFNGVSAYTRMITTNMYIAFWDAADYANVPRANLGATQQGVYWMVTPLISANRQYIVMEIWPQFSRVTSMENYDVMVALRDDDSGRSQTYILPAQRPNVEYVTIRSELIVPDNGVVLSGGLMEDRRTTRTSSVPVLTSIPYLGRAFKSEYYTFEKQNLIIAVHGKIVELE